MSDRGLTLALQRFHDDPGFYDLVKQDPQNTLGIYDLDDEQRTALIDAVHHDKHEAITALAEEIGMDWKAPHLSGLGAPSDDDDATGRSVKAPTALPNAFTGEGYDAHGGTSSTDRGVNRPA